jgi:hypothetical protein
MSAVFSTGKSGLFVFRKLPTDQNRCKPELGPPRRTDWANNGRLLLPSALKFLRDLWIAKIVFIEVKQVQALPVLNFTLTDIVQVWLPVPIVNQIFRDMRRQKNVSGIPTVEDSLRNVDPRSCHVQSVVNVSNSIYRATVNSHSQLDARMVP